MPQKPRLSKPGSAEGRRRSRYPTGLLSALATRRVALGLSQARLDSRIGVAEGMVGAWERGIYSPKLDLLALWAETLGMEIEIKAKEAK